MKPKKTDFLYSFLAKVVEVIDGDTIKVVVDQGFGSFRKEVVRLQGIDAPEHKDDPEGALAAAEYLTKLLPKDSEVMLQSHKPEPREKYRRYCGRVFFRDGNLWRCANDASLEAGVTKVYQG